MKILFDMRKGSGGASYGSSLLFQSFEMVKNTRTGVKVKVVNKLRSVSDVPSRFIYIILSEYDKTGCVTGNGLNILNSLLHRKKTSVEKMNKETIM